jgi:hypothetical protein
MAAQYESRPQSPWNGYFETIRRGYTDNQLPTRYLTGAVAETRREYDEAHPKKYDFNWRKPI